MHGGLSFTKQHTLMVGHEFRVHTYWFSTCDAYLKTIPKVGKHKSELGAKIGFRVESVKIEVMINSWKNDTVFKKTSLRLQE